MKATAPFVLLVVLLGAASCSKPANTEAPPEEPMAPLRQPERLKRLIETADSHSFYEEPYGKPKDELVYDYDKMSQWRDYTTWDYKKIAGESKEYYQIALAHYNKKEYAEALTNFENAINIYTFGSYYYQYGLCLMDSGDLNNAKKALEKAEVRIFWEWGDDDPIERDLYTYDSSGIPRELYFSSYNLACLASLNSDPSACTRYLRRALYFGYPYMDHLKNDPDLKNYFNSGTDGAYMREIEQFYREGFTNAVTGKAYTKLLPLGYTESYIFLDDHNMLFIDSNENRFLGTYEVKNYFIIIINYLISFSPQEKYEYLRIGDVIGKPLAGIKDQIKRWQKMPTEEMQTTIAAHKEKYPDVWPGNESRLLIDENASDRETARFLENNFFLTLETITKCTLDYESGNGKTWLTMWADYGGGPKMTYDLYLFTIKSGDYKRRWIPASLYGDMSDRVLLEMGGKKRQFGVLQNLDSGRFYKRGWQYDVNRDGADELIIIHDEEADEQLGLLVLGYDKQTDQFVEYLRLTTTIWDMKKGPAPVQYMEHKGKWGFNCFLAKEKEWYFFSWDAKTKTYIKEAFDNF